MYTPRIAVYTPRYKSMHQFHTTHRTEAKTYIYKESHYKREANRPKKQQKLKLTAKGQRKQKRHKMAKTKANRFATTHKAIRPGRQASRPRRSTSHKSRPLGDQPPLQQLSN